jgi:hypothetical protein
MKLTLSLSVRTRGALPPFITHLQDVILNEVQEQEEISRKLSIAVVYF